jgi:hypothetical protein
MTVSALHRLTPTPPICKVLDTTGHCLRRMLTSPSSEDIDKVIGPGLVKLVNILLAKR